ncbi:hypothetical protein [Rhodovulum adriaticum]|uniref:hypothetical protein n=1 Tax=Rhodovulum adriaticum TaxID=35804 RepID=UPI001048BA35|nr:hypothetical protein [Rhodovulum adriaticum]MBK1634344.1 hypothetical protein [Rhodovulum adriaticum]
MGCLLCHGKSCLFGLSGQGVQHEAGGQHRVRPAQGRGMGEAGAHAGRFEIMAQGGEAQGQRARVSADKARGAMAGGLDLDPDRAVGRLQRGVQPGQVRGSSREGRVQVPGQGRGIDMREEAPLGHMPG